MNTVVTAFSNTFSLVAALAAIICVADVFGWRPPTASESTGNLPIVSVAQTPEAIEFSPGFIKI